MARPLNTYKMKHIQLRVDLGSSDYFANDPNQPRLVAYLNGLNDFSNVWNSYINIPILTRDGRPTGISNGTANFNISNPAQFLNPPVAGFSGGRPTSYVYVFNAPAFGACQALVTPQGPAARSLYQVMQQIHDHKPFLKYIKVQLYCSVPGFATLIDSLGKFYIGEMRDSLTGGSPISDSLDLRELYKPDATNSGYSDPQAYLNAINSGTFYLNQTYLEVNVPINRKIDGNTMLAINTPVDVVTQVRQLVTLFFE